MKKQMLNLGKALNKAEQKAINGGGKCNHEEIDWLYYYCNDSCVDPRYHHFPPC